MLRKEWSLIANSILVQLSVGLVLFFAIYRTFMAGNLDFDANRRLAVFAMFFAGPVVIAGMLISLFHLGNPLRAPSAIKNIRSSWLSREVVLTSAYCALWLVTFLVESGDGNSTFLSWITALVGVVAVLSMANIYYATGRPGWTDLNTFTSFFGSVVIFGVVSSFLIFLSSGSVEPLVTKILNMLGYLFIAILFLRFVQQWPLFSRLKQDKGRHISNMVSASSENEANIKQYKSLTMLGLGCSGLGVLFAMLVLITANSEPWAALIPIAALLVIAGEVLGRSGFYALGLSDR